MGIGLLQSRVFWFNALALVIIVANGFGFANFQHDAALDQYASIVILVINVLLRLITKQPITALVKTK